MVDRARRGEGRRDRAAMTLLRGWRASPVVVPLVVAAAVLVVDQGTKQWALSALVDEPIDLVWTLKFRLTFNSGMAFGAGSGIGPLIGIVAVAVVVVLVRHAMSSATQLARVAAGVLLGGAVGNLVDRLIRDDAWLRGRVVDFIDLGWFPVFNVADMAINVGAVLLVIAMWREARAVQGDHAARDSGSGFHQ